MFKIDGIGLDTPGDGNSAVFYHKPLVGPTIAGWKINFEINDGKTRAAIIDNNGNFGVGTTTPQYKADINGSLNGGTIYEGDVLLTTKYFTSNSIANYLTSNAILSSSNYYSNVAVFNSNAYFQSTVFVNNTLSASTVVENGITLSSKYLKPIRLIINTAQFYYDSTNSLYTYDLNIEQYLPALNILGSWSGIKARIFEIQTTQVFDFQNIQFWNYGNKSNPQAAITVPYCNIEKYVIYMTNSDYNKNPQSNYCNFIYYGKLNNGNIGYWSCLPNNFNYIRFMTPIDWTLYVNIFPILYND